jgi:hypothetical protein
MAAGPTDHVWELREPIALMPKPVTRPWGSVTEPPRHRRDAAHPARISPRWVARWTAMARVRLVALLLAAGTSAIGMLACGGIVGMSPSMLPLPTLRRSQRRRPS